MIGSSDNYASVTNIEFVARRNFMHDNLHSRPIAQVSVMIVAIFLIGRQHRHHCVDNFLHSDGAIDNCRRRFGSQNPTSCN